MGLLGFILKLPSQGRKLLIYVIVIAQWQGFIVSKQIESEGKAQGQGLFTAAINPWPPVL